VIENKAATMLLEIVSAERSLYSGQVCRLEVVGSLGELGIYPGHTPLLTPLIPGDVRVVYADNSEGVFYLSGGMLEVQPKVATILADVAERAEDLDESAALIAKEKAELALSNQNSEVDYSRALSELAEAVAQLRAIARLRKK
jgi:F-type H+-transporting ATPase subunit epsilon